MRQTLKKTAVLQQKQKQQTWEKSNHYHWRKTLYNAVGMAYTLKE